MEKLKCHTPDFTAENIQKLAALFPNCVVEAKDAQGSLTKAIDFDQLRQELSTSVVEGPRERYHLDWPGKREALLAANAPIAKTLRPFREESVNFDTTKNLFIEGDNLDALKLLQEAYLNRVKLIYIDPPYNTGNDFVYDDIFAEHADEYMQRSTQKDEVGNRLVANTEANGRFHSDWLSMIYSRLKLARNLLSPDGAIFISIDDHEGANLKRVCDEIFGADNYKGTIVRTTGQTTGQDSGGLGSSFDYVLVYFRDQDCELSGLPLNESDLERYQDSDERGKYALWQLRKTGSGDRREDRPTMFFAVKDPDGNDVYPIGPGGYESRWRFDPKGYARLVAEGFVFWKKRPKGNSEEWWPYVKTYLEGQTKRPSPLWDDLPGSKKASIDLRALLGDNVFSNPKPVELIERILQILPGSGNDYFVLDFFAGSGTTAHSVMALNAKDNGTRRFILVQLPERLDPENKDQKLAAEFCSQLGKPQIISELTKERLRRAGIKLREDNATSAPNLDVGFRVFKIDASNMKAVYYAPDAVKQSDLVAHADNIKEDRMPEDLLFQVLVDWGVDLALPIAKETIAGKVVFFVDGNALAACFDASISEELVKDLAKRKPLRAVFRDSSYGSDSVKINVEQIFKLLSPTTEIKSL
jgi:adenine-specific DNA-methyltransferase